MVSAQSSRSPSAVFFRLELIFFRHFLHLQFFFIFLGLKLVFFRHFLHLELFFLCLHLQFVFFLSLDRLLLFCNRIALEGGLWRGAGNLFCYRIGFLLVHVTWSVDGHTAAIVYHARALLHHVGHLMSQELLTTGRLGIVLALAKEDITAGGESLGANLTVKRI